jgi:DNA polymerase III delta subunit
MNYFIHGDYHLKSRQFLTGLVSSAKNQGKDIFKVDGMKADINEIIQATSSNSLFGAEKTVVIENLFSRQKSKNLDEILQFIKKYDGSNEIIFWEKKSLGKYYKEVCQRLFL